MKKKIAFKTPIPLGRTRDASDYLFPYELVDSTFVGMPEEKSKTSDFDIKVGATRSLVACWNLDNNDLIKVLFEYGKRHIIQKLKDGALSAEEELLLSTSTAEVPCFFDPSRIPNPTGTTVEVDLGGVSFMEDQTFLQLASLIIDHRDNINAIFSSIHKERLILLNEERDLLQLFRDASNSEEFFYRICALANAATNFNIKILRQLTGISDTQIKSISLIENYLEKINFPSPEIIITLRSINRIRQGYPVHGDQVDGVLEAHRYFNLPYPIADFSKSWKSLLIHYLNALKKLLEILKQKA
jgi:hypothetical protein